MITSASIGGLAVAAGLSLLGSIPSGSNTAAAADRAHTVNVYAWAEYFPPALLEKFQDRKSVV